VGSPSLIMKMSLKRTSVIDSTHRINIAILCAGNINIDHISDEILKSLDALIKVKWRPHSTWDFSEIVSSKDFQHLYHISLFISEAF
jgi:hypothetical protein